MLSLIVQGDSYNWDKYLNATLFAYNANPQASTCFLLFYLDHFWELTFSIDKNCVTN